MSCVRARRVVERICRRLYQHHLSADAGTQPLQGICDKMQKFCPPTIMAQVRMILHYGNFGAHGETTQDNDDTLAQPVSISDPEMARLGASLDDIVVFFLTRNIEISTVEGCTEARLVIRRGNQLSSSDLENMFCLARTVYGTDVISSSEGFHKRHIANPDIFSAIFDQEENLCAGFLSVVPLDRTGFLKTLNPAFDDEIDIRDIHSYDFASLLYLHLSSVVVDPAYRDHSLAYKRLMDEFVKFLVELTNRDIFVAEISACAISSHGKRICQSLGMHPKFERENSTLYSSTLLPPALRLTSTDGIKLIRYYKRKYEDFRELLEDLSLT